MSQEQAVEYAKELFHLEPQPGNRRFLPAFNAGPQSE
jgi:hypothetical protein